MRWSVNVVSEGDREVSREEVVELADAVAARGGIASGIGTTSYGAQLVVEAVDRDGAMELGTAEFVRAAAGLKLGDETKAGYPEATSLVVRCTASRKEVSFTPREVLHDWGRNAGEGQGVQLQARK